MTENYVRIPLTDYSFEILVKNRLFSNNLILRHIEPTQFIGILVEYKKIWSNGIREKYFSLNFTLQRRPILPFFGDLRPKKFVQKNILLNFL